MKPYITNERHAAFKAAIDKVLNDFCDLSDQEILAVVSKMVGMIIALQDQRTMTPDKALQLVMANIELGNAEVIQSLRNAPVSGKAN